MPGRRTVIAVAVIVIAVIVASIAIWHIATRKTSSLAHEHKPLVKPVIELKEICASGGNYTVCLRYKLIKVGNVTYVEFRDAVNRTVKVKSSCKENNHSVLSSVISSRSWHRGLPQVCCWLACSSVEAVQV